MSSKQTPTSSSASLESLGSIEEFQLLSSSRPLSPIITAQEYSMMPDEERRLRTGRKILPYSAMVVDLRIPVEPPPTPEEVSIINALFQPLLKSLPSIRNLIPNLHSLAQSAEAPKDDDVLEFGLKKAEDKIWFFGVLKWLEECEEEGLRRRGMEGLREVFDGVV